MNFNHLRVFVDVAETLSFSHSAQNLNIAQPAVSRTIKTLEEDLGVQLFIRNNRKVFITPRGRDLLLTIRPLIQNIEETVFKLKDSGNEIAGEIRVGSLVEFAEHKLIPIINELNENYPSLLFKLDMRGDRELREKFLEGKLDIYLGIRPLDNENVMSFKCFDQRSVLLTNEKTNRKSLSIDQMGFVAYRDNDPLVLAYLKKFYPNKSYQTIKKVFVANSHKAMVDYLCHHPGCYGILPELSASVEQALGDKYLRKIKGRYLESPIYMSYWDYDFISPSLQLLINKVKNSS